MLRRVPLQMLKRKRIVVNRTSKMKQTTCNWIKRTLDEATGIANIQVQLLWCNILILLIGVLYAYS